MDLHAVRQGLADAVATVVCDPPLTTFAYVPEDGPTPFAYVQLEKIDFDQTFGRGLDQIELTILVMVSVADDLSAQKFVDGLLSGSGAASIKAAVDAARGAPGQSALGGAADDVHLMGTDSPPRWYEWRDGVKYYGVGLKVRVIGSGA